MYGNAPEYMKPGLSDSTKKLFQTAINMLHKILKRPYEILTKVNGFIDSLA